MEFIDNLNKYLKDNFQDTHLVNSYILLALLLTAASLAVAFTVFTGGFGLAGLFFVASLYFIQKRHTNNQKTISSLTNMSDQQNMNFKYNGTNYYALKTYSNMSEYSIYKRDMLGGLRLIATIDNIYDIAGMLDHIIDLKSSIENVEDHNNTDRSVKVCGAIKHYKIKRDGLNVDRFIVPVDTNSSNSLIKHPHIELYYYEAKYTTEKSKSNDKTKDLTKLEIVRVENSIEKDFKDILPSVYTENDLSKMLNEFNYHARDGVYVQYLDGKGPSDKIYSGVLTGKVADNNRSYIASCVQGSSFREVKNKLAKYNKRLKKLQRCSHKEGARYGTKKRKQ